MPDQNELDLAPSAPPVSQEDTSVPDLLEPLVERLRGLQSAWVALAPACLSTSGQEIVQAGRVARMELATLAKRGGDVDAESYDQVKTRLDWLEHGICTMAFGVPIHELRATLPDCLRSRRRGLLDLLDILTRHAFERSESLAPKLGVLDYLITLLCTDGDTEGRAMPHDPVMLSPNFQRLCERAASDCAAQLSEVEAEFFAAANLASDLQDEVQLRGLQKRKAQLGYSYFAPSMLRAIVTYNVALLQCVASEIWDSRDWGQQELASATGDDDTEAPSVFESDSLRSLHEALLRRIAGGPPERDSIGQVAWALDLGYLNAEERSMLTDGTVAVTELRTTIVTVGLLCRSLNVLAIELQNSELDPDTVVEKWVKELDVLQKEEVNKSIAMDNAYGEAVKLSDLRNKFLYAQMRDVYKENRGNTPRATPPPSQAEERQLRNEARELASKALTEEISPRRADEEPGTWRDLQWRLIAPAGLTLIIALALALHQLGLVDLLGRDLDRWGGSELVSVSQHLVAGHRNENGAGAAFVGTIDEDWVALGREERVGAAAELVNGLRDQGVGQVMIYDEHKILRIQALGDNIRVL